MKNNIETKINKGVELLKEAITQYDLGNTSNAYQIYTEANKYLQEAYQKSNTVEGQNDIKYGDNRNFGVLYKIFESNQRNLLNDKSNTHKINKIMNLIKENKVLFNQFLTYNAFTNPTNVENVTEYVNEAVSLAKFYTPDTLKKHNNILLNLIKESQLDENVIISDDEYQMFENIEYILTHPKNYNNINEMTKIKSFLCEQVSDNNFIKNDKTNIDEQYNHEVNSIIKEHQSKLNEDEIKLINDVTNNPKKAKKLFNENKTCVIDLLNEEIKNGNDVDEWKTILENINNKEFNQKTALIDIAELIELKNTLK
jgi:hypothetical protein